jgi:hypothetical protein
LVRSGWWVNTARLYTLCPSGPGGLARQRPGYLATTAHNYFKFYKLLSMPCSHPTHGTNSSVCCNLFPAESELTIHLVFRTVSAQVYRDWALLLCLISDHLLRSPRSQSDTDNTDDTLTPPCAAPKLSLPRDQHPLRVNSLLANTRQVQTPQRPKLIREKPIVSNPVIRVAAVIAIRVHH